MRGSGSSPTTSRSAVERAAGASFVLRLLLVTGLLLTVGAWSRSAVGEQLMQTIESDLGSVLDADVKALELWVQAQTRNVKAIAGRPHYRLRILEQLVLAEGLDDKDALCLAEPLETLRQELGPLVQELGFVEFVILDPQGRSVGDQFDCTITRQALGGVDDQFQQALQGETLVTRPFLDPNAPDAAGNMSERPAMFALTPVRDDAGEVQGVLGLRLDPEDEFSGILDVARTGSSGRTYAFDRQGVLLSRLRDDDVLRRSGGVAPDRPVALNAVLASPEGETLLPVRRAQGQQTSGVESHPYLDDRGIEVVGAWRWLDGLGFGVATQVDAAEAMAPVTALTNVFSLLCGLLLLAGIAALVTVRVAGVVRSRAARAQAELDELRQLGQYELLEKLGEGGMGEVYRARHAMLRRPTALKLLRGGDDEDMARFEREVQLTSVLTHPNTISIYDFGRTPEGVFYYAMELLEGTSLDDIVSSTGPMPPARVIHILRQVCGSLAEAHQAGLIHRDIKPANVLLCRQGLDDDVVKVLDFGLVKDTRASESDQLAATREGSITGTPLYMSPEAIRDPRQVDARSDLYAVGAVGYFLLTGSDLFEGTVVEVLVRQTNEAPDRPTARLGKPLPEDLEEVVLKCLAKDPGERYADAQALIEALDGCQDAGSWDPSQAQGWWDEHPGCKDGRCEITLPGAEDVRVPRGGDVTVSAIEIDLDSRSFRF